MKKVINKGYTLKVESWENDGDHDNTCFFTVDTREEAEAIYKMCTTLFKSKNSGIEGAIGNSSNDMSDAQYEMIKVHIVKFMRENPVLIKWFDYSYDDIDKLSDDELANICSEYGNELMGSSEYFCYRVCESCEVTYSPEDIYLEEIKF